MGENKGHRIKGPRHDDDVDDLGINTPGGNRQSVQGGRQGAGHQQQASKQSGGQLASGGTPAQGGLGSRRGESAQDASQAWSPDQGDQQRGNR